MPQFFWHFQCMMFMLGKEDQYLGVFPTSVHWCVVTSRFLPGLGGQAVGHAGFVGLAAYYHQIRQFSKDVGTTSLTGISEPSFGVSSDVFIPSSCISNTPGPLHFKGKKDRDCPHPKQTFSVFLCPDLGFLVIKWLIKLLTYSSANKHRNVSYY